MLQRVLDEHCEVKPAADSGPEEITVKPAREISSKSLQNPSDPEAGYSGHKGQGYQVQVMETYCDSEVPQVKAQTLNLITHVAVAPAYESDTQALLPALEDTQARELGPEEVLARHSLWQRRQLPAGRGPERGGRCPRDWAAPGGGLFSGGLSDVAGRPGPGLPPRGGAGGRELPQAPV